MNFLDSTEEPWYRCEVDLYDVFEPNYIREALTEKPLNLGDLIFGTETWAAFPKVTVSDTSNTNPLVVMFRNRGKFILNA
jgi:hypothetical protein